MKLDNKNPDISKKFILNSIKDLDSNDCYDIGQLIKMKISDYSMIWTTGKGTYIDLDKLSDDIIFELHAMVYTKLQRIKEKKTFRNFYIWRRKKKS